MAQNRHMLLEDIARTSAAVAETSSRLAKIELLAECLRRARPDEISVAVAYLSGDLPLGTIGIGWASLRDLPPAAAPQPTLEVLEVEASLRRIGATTGRGSQATRRSELARLFSRATEPERRFLIALLMGELRQGALEGVMVEAVARAAEVPSSEVRRAVMLAGNLGVVAAAAVAGGPKGLSEFRLTLLRPLQPMLAHTAKDIQGALGRVRPAAVEAVRGLSVRAVVLDGEAIALRSDDRPHPFGVTMSRFGSRLEVEHLRTMVPLSPFFFDCLHLDGQDLLDRPARERFAALAEQLPQSMTVPRVEVDDPTEAERFLDRALDRGHEGVMVKALDAPYEAGRRGASWLKVKRAHTLDLVVLAAEWGHGRRRGWLSNLHLGARDPESGGFVMLGKTFKGMTDQMLAWQTERLQHLETSRDAYTVYVRPELVVEVAFDGLQASPRYPGGLALRFARIKGYRPDKGPADADTIETVRSIYAGRPAESP